MHKDLESFGERLRRLGEERGWTMAQLAKRAGIEKSHFHRLRRGERSWQPDQLARLAAQFGISLSELVDGSDAECLTTKAEHLRDSQHLKELTEAAARLQAVDHEKAALECELQRVTTELGTALAAAEQAAAANRQLKAERDDALARLAKANDRYLSERSKRGVAEHALATVQQEVTKFQGIAHQNWVSASYWEKQAGAAAKASKEAAAGAKVSWGVAAVSVMAALAMNSSED